MAEEFATKEFHTIFEPGLWLQLMKFIRDRYENLAAHGNGRLARQLVTGANRWREDRFFAGKIASSLNPVLEMAPEPAPALDRSGSQRPGQPVDEMAAFPFIADDFNMKRKMKTEELKAKVEHKVSGLVGMDGDPQALLDEAQTTATFFEMSGDRAALEMCLNLVIYGNPGTAQLFSVFTTCLRKASRETSH